MDGVTPRCMLAVLIGFIEKGAGREGRNVSDSWVGVGGEIWVGNDQYILHTCIKLSKNK